MLVNGGTLQEFRLFLTINAKIWWRSVSSIEVAAIVLYTLFVLIVFAQFAATAIAIIFTSDSAQLKEVYSWYTAEVGLLIQLAFLNSVWLGQLFFTRASRMQFSENRKLIALGFSMNKVVRFLNLAALMHPMNLFFHLIWLFYFIPLASDLFGVIVVVMLVLTNYGVISMVKSRFKTGSDKQQWVNAGLMLFIFVWILIGPQIIARSEFTFSQEWVESLLSWLVWSPGMLMIYFGEGAGFTLKGGGSAAGMVMVLIGLWMVLRSDTRSALQQPMEQSKRLTGSRWTLKMLKRWFGKEGGKYLYSVWNHVYCRTQVLFIYFFVAIYLVLMLTTEEGLISPSFAMIMFTLIPVTYLMVMLSNTFGFENRELLLSLQFPAEKKQIFLRRIFSALAISATGSAFIFVLIPFLVSEWLTMIQMLFGVLLICFTFLYFISWSSFENYKKIEQVSLMSISNPVVPSSVSFTSFFVVLFAGLLSFPVFESFQIIHVLVLFILNLVLLRLLINRFKTAGNLITRKLIPKLWNEL
ncbi:MAG: hypothetical protein JJU46_01170 [Balneolaceae bacterium]|nr:hypothetical protein [Balneolaceae bacterium]